MTFYKFMSILALGVVLLLDQATNVEACSCFINSGGLCDDVDASGVVLHATALSR